MLLGALWVIILAVVLLVVLAFITITVFSLYIQPSLWRNFFIGKTYPQPKGLPFIGNLHQLLKPRDELFELLTTWRKELGGRFVIRMFSLVVFHIAEPEAMEVVLSSSKHITKGRVYDYLHPWLGQGLLTSQGKQWQARRKLLTPAFHFKILDQFSEHLEKHANTLVDELDLARRAAGGKPVDVCEIVSRTTLRAIMVTAMGKVDFRIDNNSTNVQTKKSYFDAIHRVGTATVNRMMRPWLWPEPLFKLSSMYSSFRKDLDTLHGFTSKVIAERKEILLRRGEDQAPEEGLAGGRRKQLRPFLDVLINAQRDGADLSDTDIREEVDTFMFEGHDTTSVALSWAMDLLGRNPDVQDRLAEELSGAGIDWDSVSKLPYLDRVLKECLRLRPSVHYISRHLNQDAVLPNGQILPSNSVVTVLIYQMHHDPNIYPDPERFDPDRFLPEVEQTRHPFAYVPFSAGPRNCIGKRFAVMELKLLLSAVVRSFRISAIGKDGEHRIIADLVLRPKSGIFLQLTPR